MNEMDMDMDIMEIVDMMEEAIEKASAVPLTGKVMIDKGELLDYIQEIRLVYPDELKEAKWVKEERQRILSEAENRAELFRRMPKKLKCSLLTNTKLQRLHMNRLMSLLMLSQQKSIEIKTDTDQYVDDVLNDVEHRLDLLLRKVREDRGYFNNN